MIKSVEEIGLADIDTALPDNQLIPWASESTPPCIPELVQLFHAINSLNTHHQPYMLQFVGSVPGEGVSMIASSFIEISASQCGYPVLLVNCSPKAANTDRTLSLIDAYLQTGSINQAIRPADGHPGIGLARLSTKKDARLNINAASLGDLFKLAKREFSIVVLDCPPASMSPESLALARFCNCSVLVVEAESTSRKMVAKTKQALERFDGNIVGVVFNKYQSYIPRWLNNWL
jgi:Mrp family chromosome partitioning ATPase